MADMSPAATTLNNAVTNPTASTLNQSTTGSTTGSAGTSPWDYSSDFRNVPINGQTSNEWDKTQIGDTSMLTPIYQGRTIAPVRDVAEKLGAQVSYDPQTGNVTVNGNKITPTTIDQGRSFAPIHDIVQAAGLPASSVKWDSQSKTASVYQPQSHQQQQQPFTPYQMPSMNFGGMPQAPQLQPYQAPNLSMYYQNLMPMQQSFTPNWTQYYNQAHQQFDPTTNADVNQLTNKMNSDISASDAKMNQRGLWNSGIAQSVENDIRGKSSDAIAKVIATSQSNIAKVAQQLYTDAFDQYYKGNTMAIQNNQMWLNQAMNQEKQSYAEWLGNQKLTLQQYDSALNAWDKAANVALKQAQLNMENAHYNNQLSMDLYKTNLPYQAMTQYQQADLNQRMQQSLLPYEYQTMNNRADNSLKQFEFNNLSAQQKVQDSFDQQKINETARHDQQLESIDWSNAQTNRGKLNEDINNNITKAKEFAATMKNSQLKEQVSGLTEQMKQSSINLDSLNKQKTSIMNNLASANDQQRAFYQSQLNGVNQQIAAEMANVQNAQNGINQRLQLDSSSQFANEPGPSTSDVGNDLPGFPLIQ